MKGKCKGRVSVKKEGEVQRKGKCKGMGSVKEGEV